jgi:hypothetical protein
MAQPYRCPEIHWLLLLLLLLLVVVVLVLVLVLLSLVGNALFTKCTVLRGAIRAFCHHLP